MGRSFFAVAALATVLASCTGGGSQHIPAVVPTTAAQSMFAVPPKLQLAVPPKPPSFVPAKPPPFQPPTLSMSRTRSSIVTNTQHASFFAGETALSNGVYYLTLPNGNVFGYYAYLPDANYIYHFDMGYEYVVDANDGVGGVYLYDFASSHWWYTGRQYPFPYIYDFSLTAFLYYYPDTNNAGHYTTNPRYFYDFTTQEILTLPIQYASVAEIRLSLRTPALTLGTAGTAVLDVNAYDANSALISAPAYYASAITVQADSPAVTLSRTSIPGANHPITITYGGGTAPSTVNFTATMQGVPSNLIVGAGLAVVPSQNFMILGIGGNGVFAASFPTNAGNDAPAFLSTEQYDASYGVSSLSFAANPNGGYAFGSYTAGAPGSLGTCSVETVSAAGARKTNSAVASTTAQFCRLFYDGSGNLLVSDVANGAQVLHRYSQAQDGTLVSMGTLALSGPQVPGSSSTAVAVAIAVDPTGRIAVMTSQPRILVFPAGATGTQGTVASFPVVGNDAAAAPDGTFRVLQRFLPVSPATTATQTVRNYDAAGNLLGSFSFAGPSLASIAVDAAGETLVGLSPPFSYATPYGAIVDVFSANASGTVVPARTVGGPLTHLASTVRGPRIVPATSGPSSVAGDMFALAPSRTWTYHAVDAYGDPAFTISMYDDPQTANSISSLVGFEQAGTQVDALHGTVIGAVGITAVADGYRANSYASYSNSASGTVPGTPLLVPNSLQRGQSWQPLPTLNAYVASVGPVPGMSACPNAPTAGATVQYTIGSDIETASFVPGCGISHFVDNSGTEFTLTAVTAHPEVGQLAIARRAQSATIIDTLHALWQRVLVKRAVGPPR